MAFKKLNSRQKRKVRIRKRISGTAERPRFTVFKSNKNVYAQLVDDVAQKTLVSASSIKETTGANKSGASVVGKLLAEKALEQNIKEVVFDRNGYQYHGVIKQIADSAREAGLKL